MTALRQQMIRQMDLKNLSPHTRRSYLSAVTNLASHYQQSPENITAEMIEDYLLFAKVQDIDDPSLRVKRVTTSMTRY